MKSVPNQPPASDPGSVRLALVGEAPGAEEVLAGIPFCGQSGRVLNELLGHAGLSRSQVFVGNVAQVRPSASSNEFHLFDWNGAAVQESIAALREDLAHFRPHIVVALGNAALHLLRHGNSGPPKSAKRGFFQWPSRVGVWRGSLFLAAASFDSFEAAELRFRDGGNFAADCGATGTDALSQERSCSGSAATSSSEHRVSLAGTAETDTKAAQNMDRIQELSGSPVRPEPADRDGQPFLAAAAPACEAAFKAGSGAGATLSVEKCPSSAAGATLPATGPLRAPFSNAAAGGSVGVQWPLGARHSSPASDPTKLAGQAGETGSIPGQPLPLSGSDQTGNPSEANAMTAGERLCAPGASSSHCPLPAAPGAGTGSLKPSSAKVQVLGRQPAFNASAPATFKALATYHPAATFRDPSFLYPLGCDLRRAVAEARTPALSLPERRIVWGLSVDEIEARCDAIREARAPVGFDIEGGLRGLQCCSFATTPHDAFVVDLMGLNADGPRIYRALAAVLEDAAVPKVCWNAAYERAILRAVADIELRGYEDGMLAWWERFSELPKGLDFVASILTREPYWAEGIGWDRKTGAPRVTGPPFWRYNGIDSCVTLEIWRDPLIRAVVESRVPVPFEVAI